MSQQLQVFLLSMIPIIEQRGAIPLGFVYEMEPMTIFLLSLFGSLVPSPFILLLFNQIYKFLGSKSFFNKFVNLIDHKIAKYADKL
ncbi:MAG TPA: small multi-drug export protein, partial [Proteiniclasticum sp.]|nr:small multi-drug export protein [Proteiniclasticum sp.]